MRYKKIIIPIVILLFIFLAIPLHYIYMVYFIHSWDEGSISISCEKNPITNEKILIKKTVVEDGKEVIVKGSNRECDDYIF